jgi:hypothetical protein
MAIYIGLCSTNASSGGEGGEGSEFKRIHEVSVKNISTINCPCGLSAVAYVKLRLHGSETKDDTSYLLYNFSATQFPTVLVIFHISLARFTAKRFTGGFLFIFGRRSALDFGARGEERVRGERDEQEAS